MLGNCNKRKRWKHSRGGALAGAFWGANQISTVVAGLEALRLLLIGKELGG
jgi:hypothetical protein